MNRQIDKLIYIKNPETLEPQGFILYHWIIKR